MAKVWLKLSTGWQLLAENTTAPSGAPGILRVKHTSGDWHRQVDVRDENSFPMWIYGAFGYEPDSQAPMYFGDAWYVSVVDLFGYHQVVTESSARGTSGYTTTTTTYVWRGGAAGAETERTAGSAQYLVGENLEWDWYRFYRHTTTYVTIDFDFLRAHRSFTNCVIDFQSSGASGHYRDDGPYSGASPPLLPYGYIPASSSESELSVSTNTYWTRDLSDAVTTVSHSDYADFDVLPRRYFWASGVPKRVVASGSHTPGGTPMRTIDVDDLPDTSSANSFPIDLGDVTGIPYLTFAFAIDDLVPFDASIVPAEPPIDDPTRPNHFFEEDSMDVFVQPILKLT